MKLFFYCIFLVLPFFANCQRSLDSVFKNAKVAGVQLLVIKNGSRQSYHYGVAGEQQRVSANTVFQAASLSKTVVAYITMKLFDKKLLSLDTPLYHYYTYSRIKDDPAAQRITARMVLHHLTGLPNWATNPGSKGWSTSILKTNIPPGSSWSYSGEGFMFLQLAIENLLHQSLEKIAQQEVFEPLGMSSSSFIWQSKFDSTGAFGYNKKLEITGRPEFFLPAAAYSLLTTATDFTVFLQALVNGTGLSKEAHRAMLNDMVSVKNKKTVTNKAAEHIFCALGIAVQENELGRAIWHWGDNGDFKCFFMAVPDKKESIVFFTNSENGLDVTGKILDHYFGKNTWWALQWLDAAF